MDPHHNEYLAAAAALHEQTPVPAVLPEFREGQIVHGLTAGRAWTGEILAVDGRRLHIEVGGGWLAVDAKDVTNVNN